MKRFFSAIMALLICSVIFAETKTFLSASAFGGHEVEGYSYQNWEVVPQSSMKGAPTQLKVINSDTLAVCVESVPEDRFIYYDIVPPYNPVITEADGEFGYITNVGELKTIEITVNGINRIDQVSVFLATDVNDVFGTEYKFEGNLQVIGETTLKFDNPNYIEDPAKRDIKTHPAYGGKNSSDLFIRKIRIRTVPVKGYDVSVVYIKDIKVTYDKAYTDEELAIIKSTDETFNLKSGDKSKIVDKETEKIKLKASQISVEKSKMHQASEE